LVVPLSWPAPCAVAGRAFISEPGGPEVLRPVEREVGPPEAGQIRLLQTAIAVNFHDIYVRTGSYRTLTIPGVVRAKRRSHALETRASSVRGVPITFTAPPESSSNEAPEVLDARSLGSPTVSSVRNPPKSVPLR